MLDELILVFRVRLVLISRSLRALVVRELALLNAHLALAARTRLLQRRCLPAVMFECTLHIGDPVRLCFCATRSGPLIAAQVAFVCGCMAREPWLCDALRRPDTAPAAVQLRGAVLAAVAAAAVRPVPRCPQPCAYPVQARRASAEEAAAFRALAVLVGCAGLGIAPSEAALCVQALAGCAGLERCAGSGGGPCVGLNVCSATDAALSFMILCPGFAQLVATVRHSPRRSPLPTATLMTAAGHTGRCGARHGPHAARAAGRRPGAGWPRGRPGRPCARRTQPRAAAACAAPVSTPAGTG
jgi:hypothetical protein